MSLFDEHVVHPGALGFFDVPYKSAHRRSIEFTAYGIPQPKGSTRAFMRPGMKFPVVTSDNPKTKPWQQAVAEAAQRVAGQPLVGPVRLELDFALVRPKSLPKRVHAHTKKPDLDKLVRAVKDALKGVLYLDDAQVVALSATKGYGDAPGVRVRVEAC